MPEIIVVIILGEVVLSRSISLRMYEEDCFEKLLCLYFYCIHIFLANLLNCWMFYLIFVYLFFFLSFKLYSLFLHSFMFCTFDKVTTSVSVLDLLQYMLRVYPYPPTYLYFYLIPDKWNLIIFYVKRTDSWKEIPGVCIYIIRILYWFILCYTC